MTDGLPEIPPTPNRLIEPFNPVQLDTPAANAAIRDMKGAQGSNPGVVEWRRANGELVQEANEPIKSLPFDPRADVDPERQQQLDLLASTLLANHNHNGVSFKDFGDILNTLAKSNDVTDREKANVWDSVVLDVDQKKVEWRNDGANPFALNINRTWRVAHELATFDDPYNAKIVNESQKDANNTLTLHNLFSSYEDFLWRVGPGAHSNVSNEMATRYQRNCYQDLLKSGFSAYADSWNAYFISHLPPERNAYYLDQIKANTKEFLLPVANRPKLQKLEDAYFQENRQTAPSGVRIPDTVVLTDE
jgi:hypothetical protein